MTEPSEVSEALAVIDATLAGEPVEPDYAELAELSLILAAMGEAPSPEFAAALDRRVERRFAPEPAVGGAARRRGGRRWLLAPGTAVGLAAVIALVVVLSGGRPRLPAAGLPARSSGALHGPSAPGAAGATSASATAGTSQPIPTRAAQPGLPAAGGALKSAPAPQPPTSGRQVVQSAQLALSAPASRVDAVAQQVFDVVAAQHGVVENSNVTSSSAYGNAQFSLSVPSANLGRTLDALSQLQGASVVSRSDASQDITGQVGNAGRRLAEDRALRTALLRQLAAATTAAAVSSLKAQINDVDAAISRDLATLRSLQHQVAYSQITVTINSIALPGPPVTRGGGFTLSRAVHDAGRVLVVAAGVALIALAVLVPVGLLLAIGLWLAAALRRRRREQILDLI